MGEFAAPVILLCHWLIKKIRSIAAYPEIVIGL